MKKIFTFIFFFFICSFVFADEVILYRDRIDNVYVYYYDKNLAKDRFLLADKYIFGDKVSYCLELGKKIESNVYNYSTSFAGLGISDSDLEFVKLAGYYGYDYPGHGNDRYYMASQEIIWNRLSNVNIKWAINLNPTDCIDVSNEKNEILNLMNNHYVKPSFDGKKYDKILGKKLVLTDFNNVLNLYNVTSGNARIEGNNLIIDKNAKDTKIILKKNYNSSTFFVYSSGLSQKMMSSGKMEVESNVDINIKTGSITIEKLDSVNKSNIPSGEATLNGAIYELYDEENKLIDYFEVGKKNTIDGLAIGNYYVKEKKPSKGYLLDEKIYNVVIGEVDNTIKLTVYEDVIKRRVDIFKVFASDKTGLLVGEAGIRFAIYDNSDSLVDTIITDNDGYASILLPYGRYTFKQLNTTDGYYKIEDFSVLIDSYNEKPIYKLLANGEIKAKLKIIKKDIDTNNNIVNSSIKFKVYDVKKKKFIFFSELDSDVITIDKKGEFVSKTYLPFGDYILYEVDEYMDGYLYQKNGVKFTIDENANLINDDNDILIEVPFYNKRVKGDIIVLKYGEKINIKDNTFTYGKILLEGVIFNLYADEDIYENGILVYKKDTLIGEFKTDKDGRCLISNLPLGKYRIKEIVSSYGNISVDSEYKIDLSYVDQYTDKVTSKIFINNYLPKGKLIINKYEKDTKIGLANTLIEIHNMNNEVIYKGYTDSSGKIIVDNLLSGKYYISEVEAKDGYKLLEDKIYFEIESEEVKTIDIYNERYAVPSTGKNITFSMIILLVFIIMGLIVIIKSRKFKIIGCIFIFIGSSSIISYYYRSYIDNIYNNKSISAVIENKNNIKNSKYNYIGVLEIPSLDIKRGFLSIDDKYNDVEYNVELISMNDDEIVFAAHNGNSYNSYFKNLHKLELGNAIYVIKDGVKYEYIYSDYYKVKKTGYVDIYSNKTRKSIVLITCVGSDSQAVFIGYLKSSSKI